jgi:hypothetical protein
MRAARYSAMAVCFILAMAAGRSVSGERAQTELRLFNLTTAHGIQNNEPFEPARVFAPEDDVIYLWYAAEGCAAGTVIRSTWIYLDADPPLEFADGTVTVERSDDWGQFNFRLAPGRRWSIGRYRIELRVGETLLAQTTFSVAPQMTASAVRGETFASP